MADVEDPRLFQDLDLTGARFNRVLLTGASLRGVDVGGMEIDSPWLCEGGDNTLLVNGVDVAAFVDAELNRRFPGRELREAPDPQGLRDAWAAVEAAWQQALERVSSMPTQTVEVNVGGEWTFTQTLRHLVMATDVWLRGAILNEPQPCHPIGIPHADYESDGYDMSIFTTTAPSYAEVLTVRAGRMAMVRDFLSDLSPALLEETRANPWAPQHHDTVRQCLHTILGEEWEHLRYAIRDLDAIEAVPR